MNTPLQFDEKLLLNEPDRGPRLIREFYEQYDEVSHHFSFYELNQFLRFYFEKVEYLPLSGTAKRYSWLKLPYNVFVRDIAWAASSPKTEVGRWELRQASKVEKKRLRMLRKAALASGG
jgi:hypothetical protein